MLPEIKAYVRVLGLRDDRFVEFAFSLNDDDLMVELILPKAAFAEFCGRYDAVVLDPGAVLPERVAGLYRPPEGDTAAELR